MMSAFELQGGAAMNILYIGSAGPLSLRPFHSLLASEHNIVATGVYDPVGFTDSIITLENESLELAATHNKIPLIDLSQPATEVVRRCADYPVDVIVMSCYGRRMPDEIIALAVSGCFNMHPSLLPRYRGPEPIFWQMRDAVQMGVTWHQVSSDFDAGDIALQQEVSIVDGATYSDISQLLAEAGAQLLLELLSALSANKLSMTAQVAELASYYSWPAKSDFVIDTRWSALHASNFIHATQAPGQPYSCRIGDFYYQFDRVEACENELSMQSAKVIGESLYIPCKVGVLIVHYTGKIPA
jgi:methionyl-tRNA formyltransferase